MNNYGTPPIVVEQSVEQECLASLDQFTLDKKIDQAVASRSQNLLLIGEILYILNETKGYEQLGSGYETIYKYAKDKLQRSKSWTDALIRTHAKFRVELGRPIEELADIGYGKLNKVVACTDEDNVEEVLDKCRNSTQEELSDFVKQQNGEPEVTESNEPQFELKLRGSETNMAFLMTALQQGKEEYADGYPNLTPSDISDYNAVEIICANYITSRSLDNNTDQSINQVLQRFAAANNLKEIEWTRNAE